MQAAQFVGEQPGLRPAMSLAVIGQPAERLDSAEKVTGLARYAAEIRLPEMLYARLLRPPMHGAILVSCDSTPAPNLPGVHRDQVRRLRRCPYHAMRQSFTR